MRECILSVSPRACHVEAPGIKILMSNGRPHALVKEGALFSGRFYGGDKFSFAVSSLTNRTHCAKYVFDIPQRVISIMELHADTWAAYTRMMYGGWSEWSIDCILRA